MHNPDSMYRVKGSIPKLPKCPQNLRVMFLSGIQGVLETFWASSTNNHHKDWIYTTLHKLLAVLFKLICQYPFR